MRNPSGSEMKENYVKVIRDHGKGLDATDEEMLNELHRVIDTYGLNYYERIAGHIRPRYKEEEK